MLGLQLPGGNEYLPSLREKFAQHVNKYGLSFATNEEYEFRFEIFLKKHGELVKAMSDSSQNGSFILDHNRFSTLTDEEFKRYLGKRPEMKRGEKEYARLDTSGLSADGIDWRERGAVNPIQN